MTEALGEIGSAIGDSAMHHSRTVYGEDYAEQVTKTYVDAAAELGKAGYKFVNVASIGIYGIMLDAMIEGSTLLISLYEYLLGPVLLQGYMFVLQPPMLRPKRFFVVLRPWSIALYRHSSDFTDRPVKIIITSLLDTLPKLHLYAGAVHCSLSCIDISRFTDFDRLTTLV